MENTFLCFCHSEQRRGMLRGHIVPLDRYNDTVYEETTKLELYKILYWFSERDRKILKRVQNDRR